MMKKSLLGLCAGLSVSAVVLAQSAAPAALPTASATPAPTPVPAARGPALDLAVEAAQVALDTCRARDQKIAVSVIDAAGVLKVLLAADGASPRGVASSTNKAFTALNFKAPTSQLGERVKSDKELADKVAANTSFNVRAGGIVVKVGDELIGAIGVGGARGSEVDEACAIAGLQKVQARLK